jgi:uncharacterized protein (TIGR00299 family) protein
LKTLHFDCFAGISGDMVLGALVDLGVDPDALRRELGKLGLDGWELRFFDDERGGIRGLHAEVVLDGNTDHVTHDHDHDHGHGHDHDHHHHDHEHTRHHEHGEHHHNSWKEIRALITQSGIGAGAKKRALDIFTRIAEAEAAVHGVSPEEVTFHEVGAMDSIIDIVGAAVCLDMLRPDRITSGEVELGGGTVKCAHGTLPVPAPATLNLVRGMPVRTGGFDREMTTPTGAAILAASVDEFITAGGFSEIKTGYGTGTRRTERPNLLRVSWREEGAGRSVRDDWNTEELILMQTNIDDMSGEALGFFMENLFDSGALDVTFTPCVMKKSRPGTVVSVLAPPAKLDGLRRTFFEKSAAIGFRETPVRRLSLARETEVVTGSFGEARRKNARLGGAPLRGKIEFEDRARLARERNVSLEEADRIIRAESAE